jgi:hypothetical protein
MLPSCDPPLPPHELAAWRRTFLTWVLASAAAILVFAVIGKQFPLRSPARIVSALVQGTASAIVIVMSLRSIRRLDELQLRIHLEALAIAFAGTGILATGYGFLVNAGLPDIDWGEVVWPSMVVLWVIGLVIANRRYR